MQLSLQNFSTMVDGMAASVQGACSSLIDLTVGSVVRALLESTASVGLWLQYVALQVLSMTRLATSSGSDADSWVGDFGMTRLPATAAVGQVVFTSLNPSSQSAVVPNGATVRTADGSQSFSVINGPYVRPLGIATVTAEVQAVTAGTAGNVPIGTISLLGSGISGIDTVNNVTPLAGGMAEETDTALRLRFVSYINTRAQATEQAIGYTITTVQQNLTYTILENTASDGTVVPGHIHIIVDDGSGDPATMLLDNVAAAVDAARPIGSTISIAGPSVITASVTAVLTIDADADAVTVISAASTAISSFVSALGVGQALRISRLAGLCYDASTAISNVTSMTIDGAGLDIGGTGGTVVRPGAITLTTVNP